MKSPIMLYGIKNCDTIKRAKRYLDEEKIDYQFHDYRSDGLAQDMLQQFIDGLGLKALLNTAGTTWRKLPEGQKQEVLSNAEKALDLMLTQPAVIKRPLLVQGERMLLGFSPEKYQLFLSENA